MFMRDEIREDSVLESALAIGGAAKVYYGCGTHTVNEPQQRTLSIDEPDFKRALKIPRTTPICACPNDQDLPALVPVPTYPVLRYARPILEHRLFPYCHEHGLGTKTSPESTSRL